MGQAKRKGTLEERQAMAEQREMEIARKRKEHLAKLDEFEKQSQKMVEDGVKQMINFHFSTLDKHSLTHRARSSIM